MKLVTLILVVLILIMSILIYKLPCSREHLITDTIIFLSKENTRDIYKRSNYIHSFNKYDIKARNLKTSDPVEWYNKRAINFNKSEMDKLIKTITDIKSKARKNPKRWRFLTNLTWKLAKVSDEVDFGFPHTHEDTIFLPENFLEMPLNDLFIQTLVHEMVHVWQRKMPLEFENLYTNYWDFIKTNRVCGSSDYLEYSRTNPDLSHMLYIFQGTILPLSIYNKETLDTEYIGIEVEPNDKSDGGYKIKENVTPVSLNKIQEYSDYFAISNNHYHPDELSAELIANLFIKNDNYVLPPGSQNLVKWLDLQN